MKRTATESKTSGKPGGTALLDLLELTAREQPRLLEGPLSERMCSKRWRPVG